MKPKSRIITPAEPRGGLDLREGGLLEAAVAGDGILFRPEKVVDRNTAAADRVASILARTGPAPEGADRSEDEIMEDVIADIAQARSERRARET